MVGRTGNHRPLSDNINILLLLDTLVGLQGKARGDDEDVTNDGPEGEAAQPGGKVDEPRVRTRMTACAILIELREAPTISYQDLYSGSCFLLLTPRRCSASSRSTS